MPAVITLKLRQHLICGERSPKENGCSLTRSRNHLSIRTVTFGTDMNSGWMTTVWADFGFDGYGRITRRTLGQ